MIVVLDTTETFMYIRLEGPNFELLRAYLTYTSSKLAVPQIVFDETVNHFRERLAKNVQIAEDSLHEIARLTGGKWNPGVSTVNQEEAVTAYTRHLHDQIKRLKGTVIGIEKVSVSRLIQRSLERRKPFDGEGRRGFRDAVLWETVLRELLEENQNKSVALITKNSSDFGKNGTLADSLADDCIQIGRESGSVQLFHGLQSFIDSVVKPHLDRLEEIRIQINEGCYHAFDSYEFITNHTDTIERRVDSFLRRCDLDLFLPRMMGRFHSPRLQSIESMPCELTAADVWSVDDERIAVGLALEVDGRIQCLEQKEVYYPSRDEWESECYDEEFIGDAQFSLSMTVILIRDTGEVHDYEIDDLSMKLGDKWPTPDY